MKIRNTTDFDTAAIRSLLRRVVREVEASLSKQHPRLSPDGVANRARFILAHCDVWVRQFRGKRAEDCARGAAAWRELAGKDPTRAEKALEYAERLAYEAACGTAGYASLGGGRLRMTVGGGDVATFVWLARHEVWHLFGLSHQHFPEAVMRQSAGAMAAVREVYGIEEGATLPLTVVVTKPAPTAEEREAAVLADIAEKRKRWTTKLRRAQTALRTRERYYERLAAKRKAGS